MSRRYWLPILAVGGLILAGQIQAQTIRNDASGQSSAAQRSDQPKADAPPSIPVAVQSDIKSIARALEAANDKQPSETDKRNADAQEKVANWTLPIFLIALMEMLVTAGGVWLIYRTLLYTRTAAEAARDAVIEAKEATKVARRIGEAQVRAYLSIKEAYIYFTGPDGLPFIEISVVNSGQSPALGFDWIPQISYLQETVEPIVSNVEDGWDKEHGTDIGAGVEWKAPLFLLHNFILEKEVAAHGPIPKHLAVGLTIHFSWTDVFGQTCSDYANYMGMAVAGDGEKNKREIHPANTSPWHCHLQPVAKVRDDWVPPEEAGEQTS